MPRRGTQPAAAPVRRALRPSTLQRRSAAELIAGEIRERILAGDLVPGDPLREVELSATFGVARNTVREALRLVTQGGLATHEVHRGVTVRRHSHAEVTAVFDVRGIIEAAAARRAGTLDDEEASRLRAALDVSERAAAVADSKAVLTGNLELHREIVGLLQNPRLDGIFNELLAEIRLILTSLDRDVAGPWLARNRDLVDLLITGSAEAFASSLREYLDDSHREVLSRIPQDPAGAAGEGRP
jgi:DNA-binding GntR family transcriptional regulator